MERGEEAEKGPRLLAELRPLIRRHHHVSQSQELPYLGDERLPAGQAEQPGGHQLVGLHIHQVEVDELAASPPWPHADVQVLDAIGGEEEGTVWIHLWNDTRRRYKTPTTADPSPEKSSLEQQSDQIALKSLYPYSTTTESCTSHPQKYSGTTSCQEGQEPLRNSQGLPSPGVPPHRLCLGSLCLSLTRQQWSFSAFYYSHFQLRTNKF